MGSRNWKRAKSAREFGLATLSLSGQLQWPDAKETFTGWSEPV